MSGPRPQWIKNFEGTPNGWLYWKKDRQDNGTMCHDCYPQAGYGWDGPAEHKYGAWRKAKGGPAALPSAGNGVPAPTGLCKLCVGTGVPAIPIGELDE